MVEAGMTAPVVGVERMYALPVPAEGGSVYSVLPWVLVLLMSLMGTAAVLTYEPTRQMSPLVGLRKTWFAQPAPVPLIASHAAAVPSLKNFTRKLDV
jgi:hypothetical protein